jgi:HlyD family secretion protein
MKRNATRTIVIVAILALVAVVVVLAMARQQGGPVLTRVTGYTVLKAAMTETVTGTGSFVSGTTATVTSDVAGTVMRLHVKEGVRVRSGDRLLEIDSTSYQSALDRARTAYESSRRLSLQTLLGLRTTYENAERVFARARRDYERNKELAVAEAISQEALRQSADALENASAALESSRRQLNLEMGRPLGADPILDVTGDEDLVAQLPAVVQARLAVEEAERAVRDSVPRAPIAGTVTQITVREGELAAPKTPLVRIERLDDMLAEVQIDEVDIGKIETGAQAEITSDSILGQTASGRVTEIAPIIQRVGNTRMTTVRISIEDERADLKSGASCTARITTTTRQDALAIPITAYADRNGSTYTYVLKPPAAGVETTAHTLEERKIRIGIVTVNQVEVVEGLAEGDIVATGNLSGYRNGMQVELAPEPPTAG